jgi:hypothetical protein
MGLLAVEAARAIRKGVWRYGVVLLVYLAYVLVVRPIAQQPSTPAAAVLGVGACYSSGSAGGSDGAATMFTASPGGLIVSAALWFASLPVLLLGFMHAAVCNELRTACQEPPYGFWPWPQDCTALFHQPPGLG